MATGRRIDRDELVERIDEAKATVSDELERFAENTLDYLRRESHIVTGPVRTADLGVDFRGRHVLIVVRGLDYRDDLEALRRIGYLNELRPITIGVDGELTVAEGDRIASEAEAALRRSVEYLRHVSVHYHPGRRAPA